jgi:hypothetical protein
MALLVLRGDVAVKPESSSSSERVSALVFVLGRLARTNYLDATERRRYLRSSETPKAQNAQYHRPASFRTSRRSDQSARRLLSVGNVVATGLQLVGHVLSCTHIIVEHLAVLSLLLPNLSLILPSIYTFPSYPARPAC